jgi:integrase/recombinase XerD
MPAKGQASAKKKGPVGDLSDPIGFAVMKESYLEWMREKNYSAATVHGRDVYLRYFLQWCEERSLFRPSEITKPILERYQRYLYTYRKERTGEPLTIRSQHARIIPLRAFFKWLCRKNYLLFNPASELELPRLEKRLPKHILSHQEAETILNQTDITDAFGLRDRAILEVLYSTGLRRMEIANLKLHDLDSDRGTLMVRQGKGKKDRMIPIGARAIQWITKYVEAVRPSLIGIVDDGTLFLTNLNEAFTPNRLTQLVRDYVNASEIGKKGSCHLFRHTCATLMHENGADIRFIQQLLGHADLSTTQIYTQVAIRKLKEIHTATHPAKLGNTVLADLKAEFEDNES